MYRNIKLVEEFEQSLKDLLKEDTQQDFSSFIISMQEESDIINESPSLKRIVKELDAELDEDDSEDFDGDGEDDIDPDELDNLFLGPDEEIKDLDDDDDDDIDPDELENMYLGPDKEIKDLTKDDEIDEHEEEFLSEDFTTMELEEELDDYEYLMSLDEDIEFDDEE